MWPPGIFLIVALGLLIAGLLWRLRNDRGSPAVDRYLRLVDSNSDFPCPPKGTFVNVAFVVLRLIERFYRHRSPGAVNRYLWVLDANLGFRNRPNGKFRNRSIAGKPLITTNSLGHRNGSGPVPDRNTPLIVFVGDSTTFCAEVNDDETIASAVAKELSQSFPSVAVLNAGVRGYSTLQSKRMLAEVLARYTQLEVAVYTFFPNDLVENLNPIAHFPACAPYTRWDAINETILEVNPLERMLCDHANTGSRVMDIRQFLPPEVVGPVSANEEWVSQYEWAKRNGAIPALDALLKEMHAMCSSRAIQFFATAFTTRMDGKDCELLVSRCKINNVPFIDAHEHFSDPWQDYLARRRSGILDPHYNARGAHTFALALAPFIRAVLEKKTNVPSGIQFPTGDEFEGE
jgi:hypothetical protein